MTKKLNEGFKRPARRNESKTKIETKEADNQNPARSYLDASFQGVKRLFVLAFDNTFTINAGNEVDGANRVKRNSHRKYFLPRVNTTNYNVLVDCRNFYD